MIERVIRTCLMVSENCWRNQEAKAELGGGAGGKTAASIPRDEVVDIVAVLYIQCRPLCSRPVFQARFSFTGRSS